MNREDSGQDGVIEPDLNIDTDIDQNGQGASVPTRGMVSRQLIAVSWIVVAWMAGTLVFEMTLTSEDKRYGQFDIRAASLFGLLHGHNVADN